MISPKFNKINIGEFEYFLGGYHFFIGQVKSELKTYKKMEDLFLVNYNKIETDIIYIFKRVTTSTVNCIPQVENKKTYHNCANLNSINNLGLVFSRK